MSNLYQDIRTALQDQAALTPGFPAAANRAYENSKFTPPVKTPWVAMSLRPTNERPYSVGGDVKAHTGMFLINVYYPFDEGPAACEAMADAIRDMFDPSEHLEHGTETIFLNYAQRGPLMSDAEWAVIPVTIGWSVYSPKA